jgi:hypothetical protein
MKALIVLGVTCYLGMFFLMMAVIRGVQKELDNADKTIRDTP